MSLEPQVLGAFAHFLAEEGGDIAIANQTGDERTVHSSVLAQY